MNREKPVVSLDQFRRKKTIDLVATQPQQSATPAVPSAIKEKADHLNPRTARRLEAAMEAIATLKTKELEAIEATEKPREYRVRFSAAAVAREAGIGRTQLYEGHSGIHEMIESARADLEVTLEKRRGEKRPLSKTSLKEAMSEMERLHEAEMSRLASQQMSDLMRRAGPVLEAALKDRQNH